MRKRIGFAAAAVTIVIAAAVAAAPAPAYVSLSPNQHDFGAQQVGTASAPFTFTLRVRCIEDPGNPGSGICQSGPEPFTPSISVTGTFTVQNNTCTSTMPGNTTFGTTCTFGISFAPTLVGYQTGNVSSGDPMGFGRSTVYGTGQAAPSLGPGPVARKKKCKKRKSAAAAKKKKCRKKKK